MVNVRKRNGKKTKLNDLKKKKKKNDSCVP